MVKTTIDGDLFLADIPHGEDVKEMYRERNFVSGDLRKNLSLYFRGPSCFRIGQYSLHSSVVQGTVYSFNNGGVCPSDKKHELVCFKPVLIPLDGKGMFDECAGKENPSGTVVTGGNLYANDVALDPSSALTDILEPQQIKIGDSCEHPAEWLWWNGKLYYLGMPIYLEVQALWQWIDPRMIRRKTGMNF